MLIRKFHPMKLPLILTSQWKKHQHLPDADIVEGPLAGGHLGTNNNKLYTFNIKNRDIENNKEIKQKTNIEANVFIKIDKRDTKFADTGKINPVI